MSVFMFPGQGAQKKGMASEFIDKYPEIVANTNEIMECDFFQLIEENPGNQLTQTQFTQPAMYVTNHLHFLEHQRNNPNSQADFLLGHSLGEYNALCAAFVFSFEDGLKMVKKRGELVASCGEGAMAAVIGLEIEKVQQIIDENNLNGIDVANYNSPTQIVVSGNKDTITKSLDVFKSAHARMVVPLQVSGAFHSRYMQPAADDLFDFIKDFHFNYPKTPVIANLTAKEYPMDNTDVIKEGLKNQVSSMVRWSESIKYLLEKGQDDFIELGPGRVLAGLLRQIK